MVGGGRVWQALLLSASTGQFHIKRPVPLLGGMKITVFDGKGYFSYQFVLLGILLLLCFFLVCSLIHVE
jgi:hypothetical protein